MSTCDLEDKQIIKYDFHVEPGTEIETCIKVKPESCIYKETYVKEQFKIALCLNVSSLMVGFSLGWTAPIVVKLQNVEETPLDRVITDVEAAWLATSISIANIVVLNVSGQMMNRVGRKPYLICVSVIMFCGYTLLTAASNLYMLFAGRILAGFGTAPVIVINMIYIGEVASPNIRGIITASTGIVHVLGCLLVYSVGPYFSYPVIGYIAMAISATCIGCGFNIPESPVFYVNKGSIDGAKSSLRKLGRSKDIDTELRNMIANKNNKVANSPKQIKGAVRNWLKLFTEKINRRSLAITAILLSSQQAGGVLTILFFATTIFKNAKSSVEPHICTIILGVTELCGVIFTPFLIERFGRKILLLISTAGCAVTMGALGIYFYLDLIKYPIAAAMGWLPLMLLILFLLSYNSGFHIVPNTLLGEMFTPTVRSTGSCISFSIALLSGFVTSLSFGYMTSLGNYATFWMYACVNFVTFVFTIMCVPETKGKSLMEIQDMLAK